MTIRHGPLQKLENQLTKQQSGEIIIDIMILRFRKKYKTFAQFLKTGKGSIQNVTSLHSR